MDQRRYFVCIARNLVQVSQNSVYRPQSQCQRTEFRAGNKRTEWEAGEEHSQTGLQVKMNYEDFVIRHGEFIGEFEEMYRRFDDPWEQTQREKYASDKAIALNIIQKYERKNVVEFGSGLGRFTNSISEITDAVVGIEVSETAVRRAKAQFESLEFRCASFPDLDYLRTRQPDCIVMAEVTWYVLDHLDRFLAFLRAEMPHVLLIHLLTTYAPGVQQYGREKFTNLQEITDYFGMTAFESAKVHYPGTRAGGGSRTVLAGQMATAPPAEPGNDIG